MEVRRASGAVVRRIYLLLIGAVLMAAAVSFWSVRHPPVYQATAQVVVTLNIGAAVTDYHLGLSARLAQKYAAQTLPEDVVETVHRAVPARTPASIRRDLTLSVVAGQPLIVITAQDTDPEITLKMTNSVSLAFVNYYSLQNFLAEDALAKQETALQTQLQQLNGQIAQTQAAIASAQAKGRDTTTLRQQLTALQTQQSQISGQLANVAQQRETPLGDFWVASQATATQQIGIDSRVSAVFGAAAGLFAGICAALLLDLLDGTVRGPADTIRFAGLNTVATVPALPGEDDEPSLIREEEYGLVASSYKELVRNLAFLDATHSLQVLLVAPCGGTSNLDQVGINLAITQALAGIRTLVIDANWESPTLDMWLGLPPTKQGFFTSLAATATNPGAAFDMMMPAPINNLFALPVGPLPPNLEELLRSSLLDQLSASLREAFEYIVVLAPADLRGSAGLQLAERMDGALVVAQSSSTTGRELADVAQVLRRAHTYLAGTVLVTQHQTRSSGSSGSRHDESSLAEPMREHLISASSTRSGGAPLRTGSGRHESPENLEYQAE